MAQEGKRLMERANRWAVGVCAAALWIISVAAAKVGLDMRFFLLGWLAAGIMTLWALVELWLARPDHDGLAKARYQLYTARLNGALMEEADLRAAEDRELRRHLNHVG